MSIRNITPGKKPKELRGLTFEEIRIDISKQSNMARKLSKFDEGVWVSVQYLHAVEGETSLAEDLCRYSGYSEEEMMALQKINGSYEEEMLQFIKGMRPISIVNK